MTHYVWEVVSLEVLLWKCSNFLSPHNLKNENSKRIRTREPHYFVSFSHSRVLGFEVLVILCWGIKLEMVYYFLTCCSTFSWSLIPFKMILNGLIEIQRDSSCILLKCYSSKDVSDLILFQIGCNLFNENWVISSITLSV